MLITAKHQEGVGWGSLTESEIDSVEPPFHITITNVNGMITKVTATKKEKIGKDYIFTWRGGTIQSPCNYVREIETINKE